MDASPYMEWCRVSGQMDLIHYSFAPLILFRVPYTLDFLPYYLSIANGAGGVGIFVLYRSYRVNNKVIDLLYILTYYYTGILLVVLREGWVSYISLYAGNLP